MSVISVCSLLGILFVNNDVFLEVIFIYIYIYIHLYIFAIKIFRTEQNSPFKVFRDLGVQTESPFFASNVLLYREIGALAINIFLNIIWIIVLVRWVGTLSYELLTFTYKWYIHLRFCISSQPYTMTDTLHCHYFYI